MNRAILSILAVLFPLNLPGQMFPVRNEREVMESYYQIISVSMTSE